MLSIVFDCGEKLVISPLTQRWKRFQICRTKPSSLGSFEESIKSIPLRCIQKSTPCRGSVHEFCNNHWSENRLKVGTTHSMRTNCAERIQRASARTQNFRYMIPHGKCTSNCDTEYFSKWSMYDVIWTAWRPRVALDSMQYIINYYYY